MLIRCKNAIIIVLLCLPLLLSAQEAEKGNRSIEKRKKELKKKEQEREKEEKAEYEALLKKHRDNQTKDVRKRMKKTKKRSTKHNENRKGFFLFRPFTKKKRKRKIKSKQ